MKKNTRIRLILFLFFILQSLVTFSQVLAPFGVKYNESLKGDILVIGNNVLNRDFGTSGNRANNSYNSLGTASYSNELIDLKWIDIDSDTSTYNSSSATLTIPVASQSCYEIAYAALYWSGTYVGTDRSNVNKVKLKVPGSSTYKDLTGSVIYDYIGSTTSNTARNPYASFMDITADVIAAKEGVYTVANVASSEGGKSTSAGHSAGWTIFIVYKNPKLPSKFITSFDGFTRIRGGDLPLSIPINGFTTNPTGPVNVKLAFSALEGDNRYSDDAMEIKGNGSVAFGRVYSSLRPGDYTTTPNFFNSTINDEVGYLPNRVPSSLNTLGYDAGVVNLANPSNNIIKNGETSAQIRISTGVDWYYLFFTALAVEIIEPKIILTKLVKDVNGNDIGGANVTLGQTLYYEVGLKNTGNDDATSLTIRDQLPINVIFDIANVVLPSGVTIKSYDPITRNIVFDVRNDVVNVGDPEKKISFKVQVVPDCTSLSDACSNSIDNIAYATYFGKENTTFQITDDPSVNSNSGCIIVPKATNFLVGIDGCKFEKNVTLCTESVNLVAANGYSTYTWYSDEARTNQIATGQTLNVKDVGTYYVANLAIAPCRSIYQSFTVTRFGTTQVNPVLAFADQVVTCPNDGKKLPNIFLCGDERTIKSGITDSNNIVWEKSSCALPYGTTCADETTNCTWTTVGTGPDFVAKDGGQYRLTINYTGGCFSRYYFNVYKNELNATAISKDIICYQSGSITVGNVPSGYQYAITTDPNAVATNYQTSNVFPIYNAGSYTIHIKQVGVTSNPCIFKIKDILIKSLNLQISTFVTQPLCYGEKGSIKVGALNVGPQYYYYLYNNNSSNVIISSVGPISDSEYTFANLTPGNTYRVRITNAAVNGTTAPTCDVSDYQYIQQPSSAIVATPSIKTALTACNDGVIKVTTSGGTSPYYYSVNGSSNFQLSDEIVVTTPGKYDILVVDSKNCSISKSITVPSAPKPTYTVTNTNSICYEDKAKIEITNIVTNGYTMGYSINNGNTWSTNPLFSNLVAGTYNVVVRYKIGSGAYCIDPAQVVIVTGPSAALTASAGVAELAGCGPLLGGQPTGLIRFTNAQGGTGTYQYSFDGGATWQASASKYVLASTTSYDLRVKDSSGCEYKIPYDVILDPKPADPVINGNVNPVYNCDGTATATIFVDTPTTTTGTTYTYQYYLDNVLNTNVPSNTFINVPNGTHSVKVKYDVQTASSYSNLLQEDFGKGTYTTTSGINPAYCFEDETTTHLDPSYKCNPDEWINDGEYAVASKIRTVFSAWIVDPADHTNPSDRTNRFLCVNVGGTAGIGGILYSKPIYDVIPNQPVIISLWAENLIRAVQSSLHDPKLTIQLVNNLNGVGGTETIVATTDTNNPWVIPKSEKWEFKELSLNPGTYSNLSFVVRSYSNEFNGNDVLIDDIWVRQIPKSCGNEREFTVIIDSNNAFQASQPIAQPTKCNTSSDGSITISATNFNTTTGFYYTTNNGANWFTSTTSPVTVNGLGKGTYKVIVKYDVAGTCSYSFDTVITAPTAIVASSIILTQPTCTTGATIRASATGGSGVYKYELRAANGVTVITGYAFSSNTDFTNIPAGTYTVVAKDSNDCLSPATSSLIITIPTAPTASLASTTDWCYTTADPAKLVVNVSGGKSPFTYKLDTNSAQNTNTFSNVAPGTHTILVTDSNGCTATLSNIVIASQLQLAATLVQDLTCLTNASITSSVTGGYGSPYTYTVSYNGGTPTAVTSFPYTATLSGTYVFTVTDAKSCPATSNTITVSPKTTPTLIANKTDITCNNANDGTITVTASNGFTSAYTYAIKLSSATVFTTQSTNQFTGLSAGTYNVKIIDSKGCESAVTNVVIVNPTVVTGTISATVLKCSATGTVPAVVTVTGSGGVSSYQYSFNGTSNFTSTNTFSTSTTGTVTAYIKDLNGCQIGPLSVSISALEPITAINLVDNGYDCSTMPAGGQVTLTAVKSGTSNVTNYQITSGPTGFNAAVNTTGIFQGLAAGSYVFQATDSNTNCSLTKSYTVSGTPAIVAGGSTVSPIKCFAGTGNIQFTVSGIGTNGYDYVIKNAANTTVDSNTNQTAATINLINKVADKYTITVTDRKTQCTATYAVTLVQPTAAVTITSATPTNINCKNDNSQITIVATGGTPNYTYAFGKSPSTVPTSTYGISTMLTVDTNSGADLVWDVYVKDANDCTAKRTVTIISDPTPSVSATLTNQCTASGSTFTITATGTGGTGTLTYGINGETGVFQSTPTFNVAASATPYTVWVKDANQCTASATPITVYPQLSTTAAVTKTLDCTTTPDAVITTTITGGKAPYTYTVKKGTGVASAPSASSTALTFTYPVSNANAALYTFVITDANGCTSTTTATVNAITNPTVSETHVNPLCNGSSNGSVQLVGAGGSGGYSYSTNATTGFTATSLFSGLAAGTHTFYVKDSKGCTGTVNALLVNPTTVGASAVVTTGFKCSTINAKEAALITVTGSGGSGSYTYSFDNGSSYSTTNTLTVNDNGSTQSFDIFVKDANGCISTVQNIVLAPLNLPTISGITHTPIYCSPAAATTSTVTVTRTVGTGVGTLTYEITAPAASVSNSTGLTSGVFTGLAGGITYTFKVIDANGCFAIQSHTVPVVSPIAATATKLTDVDCFANTTGSIRYNVSGFTSTYSYTVNAGTAVTGQSAATFNLPNLGAATYSVVFTDETTLCTASTSITITQPTATLSATAAQVNANCFTPTSKVTITPAGGTATYTYAYVQDNVAPINTDYTTSNVASLNPTVNPNWDVWVKDANGCTFKLDIVIVKDPTPTVTASATNQCLGVGSYTITAIGSGGTGTYTYSINAGASYQLTTTFVVTTPGTYTVRVKDANGCTADSTPLVVFPQLTLSAVLDKNITCESGNEDAKITLTANGGNGTYTYESKEASGAFTSMTNNVFTSNLPGSFTFRVTDASGNSCTASTTTAIVVTAKVDPNITTITQTQFIKCNGDNTGAIRADFDATKGQSPFTFSIDGINFNNSPTFTGLVAGTYTITIKDAKSCTDTESITITQPKPMVIVKTVIPIQCNSGTGISQGSIIIDKITDGSLGALGGTGGTAPYTYYVTGINGYNQSEVNATGETSIAFNVVDFGLYQIRIVDANGCSIIENDVLVASPVNSLGIAINSSVTCATGGTATVKITSSFAGSGPYHFNIYNGPGQIWVNDTTGGWQGETLPKETVFNNLSPGVTYTFIVYDEDTKCYYYETSTIAVPSTTSISVGNIVPKNITCNGSNDGNVSFDVVNSNTSPLDYTYEIFEAFTNISKYVSGSFTVAGSTTINVPNIPTNLVVGSYYVYIKETSGANTGCGVASANFNIKESPEILTLVATKIKAINCKEEGQISAQPQGGTAPYMYQYLLSSATAPDATSSGWVSDVTFDTAIAGDYTVYVKDAYGCVKTATVTLDEDDAPTITAPSPICYDGSTPFTITFSGTTDVDIVGAATYSVNGSAFQSTPSFTFNAAGTYNLVIQDGNGCKADVDYEVYPMLNLVADLTKPLDCTASPDAKITLTATGGNTSPSANYTYHYSTTGGAPWTAMLSNVYTATTDGTYTFRVTDANNLTVCQATTSIVLDAIPLTVLASPVITNTSCFGVDDGTIYVEVTSGEGPYKYSLDAGVTETTDNTFTGLAAGTYTVTVRNAKNCTINTVPITITKPALLDATAVVTPYSCNVTNTPQPAVVTVNGTAGTAPYQYNFDGSSTYYNANTLLVTDNGSTQTIHYYVKDTNGCTFDDTIDVAPYQKITDLTFAVLPITCTNPTRDLTVAVVGGYTPMAKYEIISPVAAIVDNGTNAVFAGLGPDTYLFKVTDANGCSFEKSHTIAPVNNITVSGQLISDVTCNETPAVNNGAVDFTVGNFAGTYSYTINGVATGSAIATGTTINLTNLGTGNHVIVVTDNTTGCTQTATVTVSQPTITLTLSEVIASRVNANCNSGAKVEVLANGGTPNYTYAFVANNATPLATDYTASATAILPFTGTTANDWDVWVKDKNGCTFKLDIVTNIDALPTIVAPATQCFVGTAFTIDLSDAAITTVPVGPVKYYTVNGSDYVSPNYTITAPGTYKLSVTDANGCTSNVVDYIVYPQLTLTATLTQDLTCAVDASITLTAAEGLAPYVTYEVNDGSGYVASANPFTTATAGTYKFRVTDSQNCQAESQDVIVTPKTTPTATPVQTNVSCIGGNDGTITLTPASGIAPYTYTLTGTGANTTGDATGIYTGLIAGSYNIVVKDAKECVSINIPVIITAPSAVLATNVVTPFGCNTANAPQDAIVTITASNGTPGYTYSFDNGVNWQNTASFTVNSAQTINYVVRDANGCSVSGSAVVAPYTPPTDMDLTASPIYCTTPGTVATVTVNTVTGGSGPYTYEIASPASAVTAPSTTNSFTGLAPDTYIIKVTDSNGCSTTKAIIVEEADKISVTPSLVNNVFCKGDSTGAVNFIVANYITPLNYTYLLSPAGTYTQTGDVISYTGLLAGNYTFTVTDNVSGCVATVTNFNIAEPVLALSSTSVATNINCNNDNATVTITAAGGTGPYKYAIAKLGDLPPTNFVSTNELVVDTNNGVDMNWTVYVKDNNGCEFNNPQTIVLDANPTISNVIATQCPSTTGTYDITVTATGFSTALEYSIDGVSFQTSNVITVNTPGTYNVTVKDANGCISASAPVTILQALILTPTVTSAPTCADGDGVVAVATTGGSGNYEYKIDGGSYGATTPFATVSSGAHTIWVRDITTSCEVSVPISLTPATLITGFVITPTSVTCKGGNDGTIIATMDTPAVGVNDNPIYMYSLNGGTPQASAVFSGLTAGSYTVVVTSERGCTDSKTIPVSEPNLIVVNAVSIEQFTCTAGTNGANMATITIDPNNVVGGSGNYLVYEFFKAGTVLPVQKGASNVYTEADFAGGSYTVNVYDDKGCMGSYGSTITINSYIRLDKINVVNTAITCSNLEDITVTAVDASGTTITGINYGLVDVSGTLTFANNTTGVFTGLNVGDYIITATNTTTTCSIQKVYYVNEPNTFLLNAVKTSDVICYGSNEGAVTINLLDSFPTPTNEAGAFNYTVTGPVGSSGTTGTAGPLNLTTLTAGQYTVSATLIGSPYCTVETTFIISQPTLALSISESHTDITCVPGTDGTISATAIGGWAGDYEFQLEKGSQIVSSWSPTTDYTDLDAGSYIVRVKDVKGCEKFTTVVLNNPPTMSITVSPDVLLSCMGDDLGMITANAAGGQGSNYTYMLNYTSETPVVSSGSQLSNVFTGLGAGTYTVTTSDGWGCEVTSATVTITEPTKVEASLTGAPVTTCNNMTTLTLTATGGTAPYSYSVTENFATTTPMIGNSVIIPVSVGTYHYYIKDNNGCISLVSNDIKIAQLEPLSIKLQLTNSDINCNGETTGVIVAEAFGGLGNYIYTLVDASTNLPIASATQSTPGNFTDLPAGNYKVNVVSGDCVENTSVIPITQPLLPLIAPFVKTDVTCNGSSNGQLVINASGGTGTIKYAISPYLNQFFDINTFTNLSPQTYTVLVQDELGCFVTFDFDIAEPAPLSTITVAGSIIPELCSGDSDGAFNIEISGGTEPYQVSLDNATGPFTQGALGQTQFYFDKLSGGSHTVYILDKLGCQAKWGVVLPDAVTLNPKAIVDYGCLNNAPSNTVTIEVDPSVSPADIVYYSLDGLTSQSTNVFTNVTPGIHFVEVEHKNGCFKETSKFNILQVDPLTVTLSNGGLNEIIATVTGGSGNYQYSFNGVSTGSSNSLIYYKTGDYQVEVVDSEGCTVTATKNFIFIDVKITNVFTPNGDGNNDTWGPTNTQNYPDLVYDVYDRYGRKIASYRQGQFWDGRYNSQELPTGDYWYVIRLNNDLDSRKFVGHFTLYR